MLVFFVLKKVTMVRYSKVGWWAMRIKKLIQLLHSTEQPISKNVLMGKMGLAESSIRKLVRDTNEVGNKNGFGIEMVREKGYILHVKSQALYDKYNVDSDGCCDIYNREQRTHMILAYILQANEFVAIDTIAESLEISRNTIIKDLNQVEELLYEYQLKLVRKPHYGIRVQGEEGDYRRAISKLVWREDYLLPTSAFNEFRKTFPFEELRDLLKEGLLSADLMVNAVALDNIARHIRILVYRARRKNFISSEQQHPSEHEEIYIQVAERISEWIGINYNIPLPKSEVLFLAAHITGKTSLENIEPEEKEIFSEKIRAILRELDEEFLTEFVSDSVLHNDLLLHMLPLMKRLYYNMQLENPLIDEIYSKYANVFVIAFRFSELIEKEYGFILSRDEAGYVAIHFAAHLERRKRMTLERYKRIAVICETGGGSSQLLRLKLESVFRNAYIVTTSTNNLQQFKEQLPELFLSTIPLKESFEGVPIIQIKHLLDDEEIRRIKERISLERSISVKQLTVPMVKDLFKENLFKVTREKDYLQLLRKSSEELVQKGFAIEGFVESVLERENKFSTVYNHGIAGPHPMKLEGLKDCISITILNKPIEWQDKRIEIIFLINLRAGHLFLHREISRLLLQIIENTSLRKRLTQAKNYREFMLELQVLL